MNEAIHVANQASQKIKEKSSEIFGDKEIFVDMVQSLQRSTVMSL